MGWNEPPDGQRPNDPWGNRGKRGDGPPDLDEVVRKLQQSLGGLFGKGSSGSNGSGGGTGGTGGVGSPAGWLLAVVLLAGWLVYDMFYIIDQQERGIVLRFGEYVTTLEPGLSMRLPRPLERVIKVNTGRINSVSHKALMLTQDENIVDVEVAVQWRIQDPQFYIFNVAQPDPTLRQVVESSIREIIGTSILDFVLTEGRAEIEASQRERMQTVLDDYDAGILIVSVDMQPAQPPEPVKDSFDDAIKAREDEQRSINQAEAYRNEVLPRARGQAARLLEEATAYKSRIVARAEGEASRFDQLRTEYERAPQVTRQRLYLDTMESVLSRNAKVLLDNDGTSNLMYLPIDKILERTGRDPQLLPQLPTDISPGTSAREREREAASRLDQRSRGVR